MVVAVARCSWARAAARTPVEPAEAEVALGDQRAHAELAGPAEEGLAAMACGALRVKRMAREGIAGAQMCQEEARVVLNGFGNPDRLLGDSCRPAELPDLRQALGEGVAGGDRVSFEFSKLVAFLG
jgi:hypothetical protein